MNWRRAMLWAGIVGPALFIAIFTIEGNMRVGYDPRRMFVSELAIGPRGWIQAANFWILGVLLVVFARGAALALGIRAGPIMLAIIGVCLFASGIFSMDAARRVHDLFGAIVFSLAPVTCFTFFWQLRHDPVWLRFRRWSLLAAVVTLTAVVAMSARIEGWEGLVQRAHLVTFLTWVATFAWRLVQLRRS